MLIVTSVIEARGISQVVGSGTAILRNVSLTVKRGELLAIIGASGCGKTTLLDTLSGLRPPTVGEVDRDLGGVGYVPQDDIIHLTLPLRRTLRYTAALRGVDRAAVDEVLRDLELADRAGTVVGRLSGGQRKRASIAAELIAKPDAIFLDEPTSGLDPARGAELMRILRALATAGSAVVLTTHNPLDAERCDKVAVLAGEGHLVFFGTPDQAKEHFGTSGLAEVYERLAGPEPAEMWARRYVGSSFFTTDGGSAAPTATTRARTPRGSWLRQFALLTERNAEILVRSRLTLAILIGSPVMVLLMFLVLFRPGAFSPSHPSPSATEMIVFWVAFGGFFFGLTYGLPQICSELAVLRRERFAGLRAGPYVLSKVAILLPVLAAVDLAFIVVLRALGRLPGTSDYAAVFVTLVLSSAAALGLGLLLSAAVREPSQATILLPMVCFPQVLFVGAILPVPVMAAVGRWISFAMSDRWAFEGLGHSLGLVPLWASGASPLGRPLLESYGNTFGRPVWVDWVILAGFAVVFLAATCVLIQQRSRGSRPVRSGARSR
jgi:ABC-type multidrug transport system ATPase subunit/ABC-type multidrug transport system permease subunit